MQGAQAVYIHIPFCARRCYYCSFISYGCLHSSHLTDYLQALIREIKQSPTLLPLSSLYIGGGTPSLLEPQHLRDILRCFNFSADCEISMEANPESLSFNKLSGYRRLGVNRLSIGMQSLNDNELHMLGRAHNAKEACRAVNEAKACGFDNVNIDLIYGLPGQASSDFTRSLRRALELAPQHISLYALSLEKDCYLSKEIESGRVREILADEATNCYEEAGELLAKRGYVQYEISNWARPSFECRHNLTYWQQNKWSAYGLASYAFNGCCRISNCTDLDSYIGRLCVGESAIGDIEKISKDDLLAEGIILALRLNKGADLGYLSKRYETDAMAKYKSAITFSLEAGLLEQEGCIIKLTSRGRLLSNEVFWRFLP